MIEWFSITHLKAHSDAKQSAFIIQGNDFIGLIWPQRQIRSRETDNDSTPCRLQDVARARAFFASFFSLTGINGRRQSRGEKY